MFTILLFLMFLLSYLLNAPYIPVTAQIHFWEYEKSMSIILKYNLYEASYPLVLLIDVHYYFNSPLIMLF